MEYANVASIRTIEMKYNAVDGTTGSSPSSHPGVPSDFLRREHHRM